MIRHTGIFIQGDVRNQNQRVYPVREIARAVNSITEKLGVGQSVMGELDHPEELAINLDRVSHLITEMWMDGADGYGKLKIVPTPMGNIVKTRAQSWEYLPVVLEMLMIAVRFQILKLSLLTLWRNQAHLMHFLEQYMKVFLT